MNYKKLLIPVLVFALIFAIAFSGCVKASDSNQDTNSLNGIQDNTNTVDDLDQTQTEDSADLEDQAQVEETQNNTTNTEDKVLYCKIDMGEVTQEYWIGKYSARLYTKGANGVFTDKIIDKEQNCTKDEKGTHACFPMDEPFDKTVEGWKTLAQLAGTCSQTDATMDLFKFE